MEMFFKCLINFSPTGFVSRQVQAAAEGWSLTRYFLIA